MEVKGQSEGISPLLHVECWSLGSAATAFYLLTSLAGSKETTLASIPKLNTKADF